MTKKSFKFGEDALKYNVVNRIDEDDEIRPWWESLTLCRGKTKQKRLCRRTAMRPYEIGPGNLYYPVTCFMHWDQDAKIRANLDKEDKHVER